MLSSEGRILQDELIFEMGKEMLEGFVKDDSGKIVIKKGIVSLSITKKWNILLKEYIKNKGYDTVEI